MGRRVDLTIPAHPRLPGRLYTPVEPGPHPVLVYLHGGGFVFGDLDTQDRLKRILVRDARVAVLSLEYALSPEHRYPTAIEQVAAALAWLRDQAGGLGLDPDRVAIAGDSAGANLALNAMIRTAGSPEQPSLGLLIYGMFSANHDTRSHRLYGGGEFGLSTQKLDWFWTHYLGDPCRRGDPGPAPLGADLSGLPKIALFAAALDPLLDDSSRLAERLRAIGRPAALTIYPGVTHGFIALTGWLDQARRLADDLATTLTRELGVGATDAGTREPIRARQSTICIASA